MNIQRGVGVIINIHEVDDVQMNVYGEDDVPRIARGNSIFIPFYVAEFLYWVHFFGV